MPRPRSTRFRRRLWRPLMSFPVVAILLLYAGCSQNRPELNVYAAVSLTEALRDLGARFENVTGTRVNFNFGSSNALALQIEAGAPADLFFPADEASLDLLDRRGLLAPGSRRALLSNSLVVITQRDSPAPIRSIQDLARPEIGRIAIAEPTSVPAGIYAREYLETVGLWDILRDRIIPVENVRAVLAAVGSGDAAAGIVYKTDAALSNKVSVVIEVSPGEGPAISYPVAVVKDARAPDLARRFVQYLLSPEARQIFAKYSFEEAQGPSQ